MYICAMKNILVIGSVGQIGSELTLELRKRYGSRNVVAGYRSTLPEGELLESGPSERIDATDIDRIAEVVKNMRLIPFTIWQLFCQPWARANR